MGNLLGRDCKIGIGLESTYGTAVPATQLLDARTDTVASKIERVASKSLRASRYSRAGVPGQEVIDGAIAVEMSPICKLLWQMILGSPASTPATTVIGTGKLTAVSTTATVETTDPHGLTSGASVTIAGATQTEYNGTYTITVTDATHFTYTFAGSATTPATTTTTITFHTSVSHVYTATEPLPFSHVKAMGAKDVSGNRIFRHSCKVNEATLRAELDELAMLDLNVVGIGSSTNDNTTATDTALFGASGYPTVAPFYFRQAAVTIAGVTTYDVTNAAVSVNNNLIPKRILNGALAAAGHVGGEALVTFDLATIWQSDALMRLGFGVASGAALPFGPGDETLTGAVQLKYTGPHITGTTTHYELTLNAPVCEFEVSEPAIESMEYITQAVKATARYNSGGSAFTVTLVNDEA